MTARRLLIVMLVLLGISTLAAALVPQRTLRRGTTSTAITQPAQTQPATAGGRILMAKIVVGGKKVPVVAGPVCSPDAKPKCTSPIHVGDQVTLLVFSRIPAELEIKEFGLVGFAAPTTPARFELLPDAPDTIGILFADSGKVAGRIEVLPAGGPKKKKRPPKSAARGGSGRP
ncbi:MAG: hypothetical protein ACJ75Z_09160 [Solirubrobacterales bacterium]